jgi:Holliday junction resolvase RusA-like endonuclease
MEAESSGIPGKGTGGRHVIYKYTIPLPPVTKKNSQRILVNRKTGMPFIAPSGAYKRYEEQAIYFLAPKPKTPLAGRCRVVTVFYMKTRRKCDVSNCLEAAHDLLVKGRILADDNYTIIESVDGSRVKYDKDNPRTEITIEELEE